MKKLFLFAIAILLLSTNLCFASQMLKPYRNEDHHFSMQIPAFVNIVSTDDENTITAKASNGKFLFCIIIKPTPNIKFSDDAILKNIHTQILSSTDEDVMRCIASKKIDAAGRRMLSDDFIIKRITDEGVVKEEMLCFTFVSNYRSFVISYTADPKLLNLCAEVIAKSIDSFADETGFY